MSRAMLLGELLPELEGLSADLAIAGLVQDSREIRPGDAFVAIAGFGAHGLNFVDAARAPAPPRSCSSRRRLPNCRRRRTRFRLPACARGWARWPTPSMATPARR